jgi:UDP-3-O-[3-hydroxymyristoyl] N-acetylglucosamine deacetylase/3-hydroxyacyl-[acyl-carrier-protein] dehydratase
MNLKQNTLQGIVKIIGIGLHTGEKVNLEIHPAAENYGYKFQRIDLPGEPTINADVDLVISTDRGTTLEQNNARVYTTEHILAALVGCGIDNALIKLDAPEIPIMDGSSQPFVHAIQQIGIQEQEANRDYFELSENIPWEDLSHWGIQ